MKALTTIFALTGMLMMASATPSTAQELSGPYAAPLANKGQDGVEASLLKMPPAEIAPNFVQSRLTGALLADSAWSSPPRFSPIRQSRTLERCTKDGGFCGGECPDGMECRNEPVGAFHICKCWDKK